MHVAQAMRSWNDDARQMANTIIEAYGEPSEATESTLVWHGNGPWKRTVVHKDPMPHRFPLPHTDAVEQVIDYRVPLEKYGEVAAFDGSVVVRRTAGEVSATCHDEGANFLALNLMHDVASDAKSADEAREAYKQAMLDVRAGKQVRYMQGLQFATDSAAADPDESIITQAELEAAQA